MGTKGSRAFFVDIYAIIEEGSHMSSSQGQISGQNSLHFRQPQLLAWMGWWGLHLQPSLFPPIMPQFYKTGLALSTIMT